MLDHRAQQLLKALVERYIAEGQPVGSRVLSRQSGLELSPATIRNVMADLEELGFIASPHTSAGRIPTPKGYRLFVDSLMVVQPLADVEITRLEGELAADRPQQLVSAAAQLLSQLSHFAGVVLTPRRREAGFRHLEFLRLSERRVLLIIVTPEGDVQNRILHTDRPYSQSQLIEATNFFNQHYAGAPFASIRRRLADELNALREDVATLMTAAVDVGEGALNADESVVLAGERNLLQSEGLASNMERLRRLFDLFEQKTSLAAPPRPVAARRWRPDLHRWRVEPGAAGRDERGHRALHGGRAGHRHAGCHRPHADGLRAGDPDRRRDGEAAVERAHAAEERRDAAPASIRWSR